VWFFNFIAEINIWRIVKLPNHYLDDVFSFNPLNTSGPGTGPMDPFRVHKKYTKFGEFSCLGGALGRQNSGFSRLRTSQGTPQNWFGLKIHPRTRDMAPGPKLIFFVRIFFFFWVQTSTSQIFCKNKWKLMILFANT